MKRSPALALLFVALTCVAQSGVDQDLQAAVNAGNQAWVDGMRRGDAAVIAATYAADAVNCSFEGQCVTGAAAIQQQMASRITTMGRARTANVNMANLVRDRDFAYEWGSAEATYASGRPLRGRYLTVWQQQPGGGWKIVRNMALPSGHDRRDYGPYPRRTEQSATLRCESNDMGRRSCAAPAEIVRVELLNQISGSPCTQGSTWGWQGTEVWVDRGCRADFTVYTYGPPPGDYRQDSRQPPYDEGITDYSDPRFTRTMRCESEAMNYRVCAAGGVVRGARLVRQLSGSPCTETQTWGWKSDGVWVDKGCRAEFEVVVR